MSNTEFNAIVEWCLVSLKEELEATRDQMFDVMAELAELRSDYQEMMADMHRLEVLAQS